MIASSYFRETLSATKLHRKFVFISVLYGLSTLVVPLATQFLVNSLALSSLFTNTLIFLLIVLILLSLAQLLRFGQLILLEFIQREIFVSEAERWKKIQVADKAHYMLEIQTLMKSFAGAFGPLVELGLAVLFGFLLIISFHPAMIFLPLISVLAFWLIFRNWESAVASSVEESDEKYNLLDRKAEGTDLTDGDLAAFLFARDNHFIFLKRATVIVSVAYVLSQLFLLSTGIYLIEQGQLSVGQLVSAEIILTGIMISVTKLPKTLDALYDLDTSKIKLEKALKGSHEHA